ncbi:hypothetical protein MLD38_024852 [Melastoma candidum]|uniref:Uncharacterized protein n=1 Tax=Melastoma candidum TaxID=119954 RepID=A0ACB9NTK1_9MYRT|nr:hypothetical protein MLD38_024852 [Melastoma candidum]
MLKVEDVLCELSRVATTGADGFNQGLPPGFRFHPTDEELITFYLAAKVFDCTLFGVEIAEIDLNRCEPWELPEVARMGEKEWYFFSLRDRKYPTGLRTNRATSAGYWKATGKDRLVHSASTGNLLGMKKTLVFYHGRAPRGEKTKWVMHEYRLDGRISCRHSCKDEWVICRIIQKSTEKKASFLDQGQQRRNRAADELQPCDTWSFSAGSRPLRCPLLQIQSQENPHLPPPNQLPHTSYESQPPSFHPQVPQYLGQEAGTEAVRKQRKAEPNLLPHLEDPLVIDPEHFYRYNLCGETIPPYILEKMVAEGGSWPADV